MQRPISLHGDLEDDPFIPALVVASEDWRERQWRDRNDGAAIWAVPLRSGPTEDDLGRRWLQLYSFAPPHNADVYIQFFVTVGKRSENNMS